MVSIFSMALLLAIAVTGIVTVLFIALSTPPSYVKFEIIHWIAAILCVVVTSIFFSAAIGAAKASKLVNQTADLVNNRTGEALGELQAFLPEELMEQGGSLKAITDSQVELARVQVDRKLHSAIIWSVVTAVVLNSLYLLLLFGTAGKRGRKHSYSDNLEDSLDSDYGSLSGSFDDIDSEL